MNHSTVFDVRDVWKIYGTKIQVEVLRGVSLTISQAEFVAIIGPSGSGKSTLMHVMGCLQRTTRGQVLLDGINVAELSEDELADIRATEIGFVFQQFNLLPLKTAQQNVELPLIFQGVAAAERNKRAVEMLHQVGLGHRLTHRPSQMSGGEQQRVAIARALVSNPKIIFADEPTGNLDTKSSREIMYILKKLNDAGKTLIVVTHDPEIAIWADRTIRLRDGRVIHDEN
ncbi:MAG TPA: ABC transporter ATP-binding protein [Dehalococcoidia bacterium]|nr:ABC transporter ATP-binding protein [Dehalococcoidia bacterium]